MFHNSQNLSFNRGAFYNVNGDFVQCREDADSRGIDLLRQHIVPGAFHNSDERYDPPKCHPRTRLAILDKLIAWIEEMEPEEFRAFWLYGSAGVGKSAILQTIAELCHARGLLLASFFFSRTSATRNNRSRLIPTLSYQIALSSPLLKEHINRIIAKDPTIFERSLDVQLRSLVVEPLLEARGREDSKIPPLIALDGLDECSSADDQCYILRELVEVFQNHPLKIRLLITSRPEQPIFTAFKCGALQLRSRCLSLDNHSLRSEASADIEVFLRQKFTEIKTSHPFQAYFPPEWPPNSDVRVILQKSSHHFIFASTAIRFVGCPRHRPVERLRAICDASFKTEETPFAELDALYSTILACVENIQPVIKILGMLIVSHRSLWGLYTTPTQSIYFISTFLGYTLEEFRGYLIDLGSLVDLNVPDSSDLRIFHASFSDFLTDERRSKQYYINRGLIHAHLAKLCFRYCGSVQNEPANGWDILRSTPRATSEQQAYANHNLLHHLGKAVLTLELQQQLAQFDATSVLIFNGSPQVAGESWRIFSEIMEGIRTSAEASFTQQLRHLDHYLRPKLAIYHSDARLRDLVTLMMCHLMDFAESEDIFSLRADLVFWAIAVLEFTPELGAKDTQCLDLFCFPLLAYRDPSTSHLMTFLCDQARAREFFINGESYASLTLRFAKQLCEPSALTRSLIDGKGIHRIGLRLFAFFLSRSSYSFELKVYLTSHLLMFRDTVEFREAVKAISTYVELAPPSTSSILDEFLSNFSKLS